MLHVREVPGRDPAEAFAAWADKLHVAWLDGAVRADPRGRYGHLCVEPFGVPEAAGERVMLDGAAVAGDPFEALRRELARWRVEPGQAPVPFAGGAVGFFGYELGGHPERLPRRHPDALCVFSPEPKGTFGDADRRRLRALADVAVSELELRRAAREAEGARAAAEACAGALRRANAEAAADRAALESEMAGHARAGAGLREAERLAALGPARGRGRAQRQRRAASGRGRGRPAGGPPR